MEVLTDAEGVCGLICLDRKENRFVSVDEQGVEQEFLSELLVDAYEALSKVFLKGYQWPFDAKKVGDGSSVIDLLVYRETILRNRRVFLDFTRNPFGMDELEHERLSAEAYSYLNSAGACFGTPIERLRKMNTPAIELYASKGVNIEKEYLEIALCVQHNNGGIAVDAWWQTSVPGLFAAGECAGTHGITRPGGSALNAGQVGSLRAAQFISASNCVGNPVDERVRDQIRAAVEKHETFCRNAIGAENTVDEALKKARKRMSDCGGAIRNIEKMRAAHAEIKRELTEFKDRYVVKSEAELTKFYRLKDTLTVQLVTLAAMMDYAENVKVSRGSALYYDKLGELRDGLEEMFRFSAQNSSETGKVIQEVSLQSKEAVIRWRPVRPIPEDNDFFETVWRRYREDGNIY